MKTHQDSDLLFAYGTLIQEEREPMADFLRKNGAYLARGYFNGKLYEIDGYPGARVSNDSEHKVYGSIFKLGENKEEVLLELDRYEGVTGEGEHKNEYTRELVEIHTPRKNYHCWVYLYNWDIEEKKRITSGDYLEWVM
ncbi:gamma-glutamylcyclotransferase family protein [Limibacter armeniacum]|uniref:gamma-glutamylcyclotransferase family protein n=1 Tax=Limibacter armeniacum TaxID=466084 RepID=UPI002FE52EF1